MLNFPGGAVVKHLLPVQGHWFNPWSGKIPHTWEQLSNCATNTEALVCPRACARNKRSRRMRSPWTTAGSWPHSPQVEKVYTQQWWPSTAKNKKLICKNNQHVLLNTELTSLILLSSLTFALRMQIRILICNKVDIITLILQQLNWAQGISLVLQWLRICLIMQKTRVQSLVRGLRSHKQQHGQK